MAIHFFQGQEDLISTYKEDSQDKNIEIIKNKISEFFNMKNVHFLFGSGTSCPAIPNMNGLFKSVETIILSKEGKKTLPKNKDDLKQKLFKSVVKKKGENLEEILGVLYSLRAYLEGCDIEDKNKLKNCNSLIKTIETCIFNNLNVFKNYANKKDDISKVLETYKSFYQKIALRNKDLSRINIFTTNNDLFNEKALDSLNINYINGFNGGLNRYFNPAMFNYTFSKRMDTSINRFEPVENMVYLYKIHGSINWIEDKNKSNSYFDIKEVFEPINKNTVLIYPTPIKQNKSLGSPYADLFREFQHKLLEPNSVIFVIGYSFSDEHINDIIYRALATNTTFNVVIINNIANEKTISNLNDNRIFRIWQDDEIISNKDGLSTSNDETANKDETISQDITNSNSAESTNKEYLHFFSRIVSELLPNIDAFKQQNDFLAEFVNQLKEVDNKNKKQNENR